MSQYKSFLNRYPLDGRLALQTGGAALLLLAIALAGSTVWLGAAALGIVGAAILVRIGPMNLLLIYSAGIWILPRLYVPGVPGLLPLHTLLIGGLGLLFLVRVATRGEHLVDVLPPLWPPVAIYAAGGFVGFIAGRNDVDTVNGIKYLIEACVMAPMLYWLVWYFVKRDRDAERIIILISASILALGLIAYIFQGSGFWTPIPFEKEGLRLSGQYQFGPLYLIVTPVLMSTQLSMLIPALCAIALNSESARSRLASKLLVVPLGLLIVLAAGRSGWMGTVVGLLIVLFFSARAGRVSIARVAAGTAAIGVTALLLTLSLGLVNDEISRRFLSFSTLLEDDTVVFRYWIWGIGFDLIKQYPFGVGFQVIRALYDYPAHNSYILWALGTGIAGFVALIIALVSWLVRVTRTLFAGAGLRNTAPLAALGAVVGGAISINGDNIATSVGWTQATLWIFMGLGAAGYSTWRNNSKAEVAQD